MPGEPQRTQPGARFGQTIDNIANAIFKAMVFGKGLGGRVVGNQLLVELVPQYNYGGGLVVDPVLTLPSIPTSGARMVFWQSSTTAEGGTGDDQIWTAYAGQTKWYRLQKYSALSGDVV